MVSWSKVSILCWWTANFTAWGTSATMKLAEAERSALGFFNGHMIFLVFPLIFQQATTWSKANMKAIDWWDKYAQI